MNFFILLISIISNILQDRAEHDTNLIFSLFHILFYRENIGTVHIISIRHFSVINENICQGIQPLTDKCQFFLIQKVPVGHKTTYKFIILLKQFSRGILVFTIIRMLNLSCGIQSRYDRTRNLYRTECFPCFISQFPIAV